MVRRVRGKILSRNNLGLVDQFLLILSSQLPAPRTNPTLNVAHCARLEWVPKLLRTHRAGGSPLALFAKVGSDGQERGDGSQFFVPGFSKFPLVDSCVS